MIPFTPFSGLSLIVHLLIILLAKIYIVYQSVFGDSAKIGNSSMDAEEKVKAWFFTTWLKSLLSIFVILAMFIATISVISIAIQTALREGAGEPQRSFIQNTFSYDRGEQYAITTAYADVDAYDVWQLKETN